MQCLQEGHREVVGRHGPGETELLTEQRGQQLGVCSCRHPVGVGVGVHHRARAGSQRHLERRQDHVGQLPRAHPYRGEVARRAGGRVAQEVLQRRHDANAFESAHVCATDKTDQERVLAEGLLDSAPAEVADHVEDGSQALVHPEAAHRRSDLRRHPLDESGVEGSRPAEGRGIDGGAPGRQPGEALLVGDGRDAEPVGRHHVALPLSKDAHSLARAREARCRRCGSAGRVRRR